MQNRGLLERKDKTGGMFQAVKSLCKAAELCAKSNTHRSAWLWEAICCGRHYRSNPLMIQYQHPEQEQNARASMAPEHPLGPSNTMQPAWLAAITPEHWDRPVPLIPPRQKYHEVHGAQHKNVFLLPFFSLLPFLMHAACKIMTDSTALP